MVTHKSVGRSSPFSQYKAPKTIPITAPPTHVFLAFSYSTLQVQFGIEGYIAAEAQSLKINFISHSNIGLCVIFRLKDMRLSRHVLC